MKNFFLLLAFLLLTIGSAQAEIVTQPAGTGGGGGSGTVTSVSVVTANGFSGTVANPTTTPAITISGGASGITLGTSSSATNPQRTGDATTGFYSANTGEADFASGGTQIMKWTSGGETVLGTLTIGTNSQATMASWTADGNGWWMNIPTNGPTGIGSGGAGNNVWIAYASSGGQFFGDINGGDLAYRNAQNQRILLGIDNGAGTANSTIAISGNAVQIATHVNYTDAAPAVSACGTSPSIDSHASDNSGKVTMGSGTLTSCTITFNSAYSTWNHCNVTPETASLVAFAYSYSLSAITVTGTSLTSAVVDYRCDGK